MDPLELTPEQEAEAARIEDILLAGARVEIRQMARLMASKENQDVLGQTEFQLRDHLLKIGARAVDATLEARKKTDTPDAV